MNILNHGFLAQLNDDDRLALYKKALDTKYPVRVIRAEAELGTRLMSEIARKMEPKMAQKLPREFGPTKVAVFTLLRVVEIFTGIF